MLWFAAGLLLLTSLACNAFAGNSMTPGPQTPTPEATVVTAVTAPPLPTGTPATLTVLVDLNVRAGPGVSYERLSYLPQGATAVIIGRALQSEWLEIACPADVQSGECWVAGGPQYVETAGVEFVEAVPVPATPTANAQLDGAGRSRLAYAAEGQLFVAGLDLSDSLPALATSPLQLTYSADVSDFAFAPDGEALAYVSKTADGNSLHVVSLDDREPRLLVSSEMLPLVAGGDAGATASINRQNAVAAGQPRHRLQYDGRQPGRPRHNKSGRFVDGDAEQRSAANIHARCRGRLVCAARCAASVVEQRRCYPDRRP